VTGQAARTGQGRKEHDGVARQLNVLAQGRPLLICQAVDSRIELQGQELAEVDRKLFSGND
jgi:hypothetical protein